MKRIISILIMCAMLTGCGSSYEYENAELSTVSQTEITSETAEKTETAEESEDIGEISYEVTEEISSDMTSPTTQPAVVTAGSPDEPTAAEIQETETVSDNTKEEKEPVFSEGSAESPTTTQHSTTSCATEKAVTTAASAAPEKPKTVQTTAPPVTTAIITTTVTEPITEPPTKPQIILQNDGTDYGKARAVYEYMRENGSGTCVNYSCQTYELCRNIGLQCYLVWTDAGLYGHVANTVCVNGTWFILDTHGGYFLEYNYGFTEMIDIDESHIADGSFISSYSYDELF